MADDDRPGPKTPLWQAREWLLGARSEGTTCPCCGQYARVYKRRLNYAMAYALVLVYRHFSLKPETEWLHLPSFLNGRGVLARGGDPAKLRYWGLLVGSGGVRDDDSGRVGEYRITELGRAFVERMTDVPAHLYLYNNDVLGSGDQRIYIDEALGKHFNYAELMSSMGPPDKRTEQPPSQTTLWWPEPSSPTKRSRRR